MGRPISVVVGALVTADDDGAGTTQKAAGAQYLVLNGAKTDGTSANNVAQSQTPAGAGALTLNGTLVSGGVAYLGQNSRVYFTCAGNDSGNTVVITGVFQTSGALTQQTETLTLANASIVASQKLYYSISSIVISGATVGAITVGRAGIATFDVARRFIITSGGDDSTRTAVVVGTDWAGSPLSETITLTNGSAASSSVSFKTVTSVLTSGSIATTVILGTNGVADSPWVRFDSYGSFAEISIQATVSGTVNYTIRQTLDDPNAIESALYRNPAGVTWVDHPDTAVVGATATKQSHYSYMPIFAKVVLNSGTGTVTTTFVQTYQD